MSHPGASSDVKRCLWNTICTPVLTYGLESIDINESNMKKLETTQGNLLKQSLGLTKRCHSTELLQSMNVHMIKNLVNRNTVSLFRRIMSVQSPAKDLNTYFISLYLCNGTIVPGTLISRLLSTGISPMSCILNNFSYMLPNFDYMNGHIDTLKYLLFHENFVKPYSDEHLLMYLLTK